MLAVAMDGDCLKPFTCDYKEIVLEEVALDGLEGTILEQLWLRVEKRISSQLSDRFKARIWDFLLNNKDVSFYELPEPREVHQIFDRFSLVDENTGYLKDPDDYLDGPYEYCPVKGDYGSCTTYSTRRTIPDRKLLDSSLEDVVAEYGNTLVLVASLEERWHALAPHAPITHLESMTPVHYCFLELIGRGRENGQMTVGKTNVTKMIKDPKLIFYNRKPLKEMGLVRTSAISQTMATKGLKSILMRLKRYHAPRIASLPKVGKMRDILEYLKDKPNMTECVDVLYKDKVVPPKFCKKMTRLFNLLKYEDRPVSKEEYKSRTPRKTEDGSVLRRYITLATESDASSSDEDTTGGTELKCQYKVGVNLLRQAYEMFLEAGKNGMTQIAVSQVLGVEFYVARMVCRVFRQRKLVKEILEDHGRQRTSKYVAIASAGAIYAKYAEQKKKIMEFFDSTSQNTEDRSSKKRKPSDDDDVPLAKKTRLDNDNSTQELDKTEQTTTDQTATDQSATDQTTSEPDAVRTYDKDAITEVTSFDCSDNGKTFTELFQSRKGPTLRQLTFANGMLKLTREKLCISGYQTISNLVAKEVGERPQDTKAIKNTVQRLVADGQLKVYQLKWPASTGVIKYSHLICAPHVKETDEIIQAKYKEITLRAFATGNRKPAAKPGNQTGKPLILFSFRRYKKLHLLHQFIVTLVRVEKRRFGDMPLGFASLVYVIPEMTVELAVGHVSPGAMTQINALKLTDELLQMRLKDTPQNVYQTLLHSSSFQSGVRSNLQILATFGLLQMCEKPSTFKNDHHSGFLKYVFYVNKNAKCYDTTGTWPRDDADLSSLERRFRFETFDDVASYWETVHSIALNTVVVNRRANIRTMPATPVRRPGDAESHDTGDGIYGDGRGPLGFDSMFFLELQRNWETQDVHTCKPAAKPVRAPRMAKSLSKIRRKMRKKKPQRKPVVRKVISTEKRRRNRPSEAGILWRDWEDRILMMCKTAIKVMSPSVQVGCLTVRNGVAKDILSIGDPKKSAGVCHRRLAVIERRSYLVHDMECLLNELRRRPELLAKYDCLLKKLRMHSIAISRFMQAATLPTMELVWILLQISKSDAYTKRTPCVAMTLEEFHANYITTEATPVQSAALYRTPPECDTEIATLKEGLIMALALKMHDGDDNAATALKIYHYLGKYDEPTRRVALDNLRKCGIIAARVKYISNIITRWAHGDVSDESFTNSKATMATYRLAVAYSRRLLNRMNSDFVNEITSVLECELPPGVVGSPSINCVLSELQECGLVSIRTVSPPVVEDSSGSSQQEMEQLNAIDIEAKFKLKIGNVSWQDSPAVNTLAEHYPRVECGGLLQKIVRNSTMDPVPDSYDTRDAVTAAMEERGDKGCTFRELMSTCELDSTTLTTKLQELEATHTAKRVGYFENRLVLTKYTTKWCIEVGCKRVMPSPWLRLDDKLNIPLFVKWCGVVVNKIFEYPGMSVVHIATDSDYITYRAVQDICDFLHSCKCVELKVLLPPEPDMFSDTDDECVEYTEYSVYEAQETIFVFPVKDALTRYAVVRKNLLDSVKDD